LLDDPSIGYTFDIMVDEFVTIVTAGMETSANTLSLLFMELSRQPEILDK
jgi:cytochrome P450